MLTEGFEQRPVYARLVSISRKGVPGKAFCLTQRMCTIGRNTDQCDIRIYRPEVSSLHSKITVDENNSLWIENLSKTNPTFLNGEKCLQQQLLKHKDIITVGTKSFLIEYPQSDEVIFMPQSNIKLEGPRLNSDVTINLSSQKKGKPESVDVKSEESINSRTIPLLFLTELNQFHNSKDILKVSSRKDSSKLQLYRAFLLRSIHTFDSSKLSKCFISSNASLYFMRSKLLRDIIGFSRFQVLSHVAKPRYSNSLSRELVHYFIRNMKKRSQWSPLREVGNLELQIAFMHYSISHPIKSLRNVSHKMCDDLLKRSFLLNSIKSKFCLNHVRSNDHAYFARAYTIASIASFNPIFLRKVRVRHDATSLLLWTRLMAEVSLKPQLRSIKQIDLHKQLFYDLSHACIGLKKARVNRRVNVIQITNLHFQLMQHSPKSLKNAKAYYMGKKFMFAQVHEELLQKPLILKRQCRALKLISLLNRDRLLKEIIAFDMTVLKKKEEFSGNGTSLSREILQQIKTCAYSGKKRLDEKFVRRVHFIFSLCLIKLCSFKTSDLFDHKNHMRKGILGSEVLFAIRENTAILRPCKTRKSTTILHKARLLHQIRVGAKLKSIKFQLPFEQPQSLLNEIKAGLHLRKVHAPRAFDNVSSLKLCYEIQNFALTKLCRIVPPKDFRIIRSLLLNALKKPMELGKVDHPLGRSSASLGFLFFSIRSGIVLKPLINTLPVQVCKEIKMFNPASLHKSRKNLNIFEVLKKLHAEIKRFNLVAGLRGIKIEERPAVSPRSQLLLEVCGYDRMCLKKAPLVGAGLGYLRRACLLRALSRVVPLRRVVPVQLEAESVTDENSSAPANRGRGRAARRAEEATEPRKYNLRSRSVRRVVRGGQ
jgi:hypothetical protein